MATLRALLAPLAIVLTYIINNIRVFYKHDLCFASGLCLFGSGAACERETGLKMACGYVVIDIEYMYNIIIGSTIFLLSPFLFHQHPPPTGGCCVI